jgi:hypothetical protein
MSAKSKSHRVPNELQGIGDAIDWLEEYVNDTGYPELADSVVDEARERIAGLERALDYCVKRGLIKVR